MAHDHGQPEGHEHDHGHDGRARAAHAHDHHHHATVSERATTAFAVGIALNFSFVLVEALFGVVGHSIALLSDAGHNFGDVLALCAAWTANVLARRVPSRRYTYGLRSSSILVALLNAIVLLIAVGAIVLESLQRLAAPQPVVGGVVIVVALLGVLINGATAFFLLRMGSDDINIKAAFAHMAADALVGVGVAASGAVMLATGWTRLDPIVSIVISIVIVIGTWRILRQALDMALHAVPEGIDADRVREHLAHQSGVAAIHDLHIWPMSTTETALTAHLVMPGGHPGDAALACIAAELQERYAIGHVTLQIETDPESACSLAPDHVV